MTREPRAIMHCTPEYDEAGTILSIRYFGTITETKKFAIEQMKKRGGKGYAFQSIPRDVVAELMEEHVPQAEFWH